MLFMVLVAWLTTESSMARSARDGEIHGSGFGGDYDGFVLFGGYPYFSPYDSDWPYYSYPYYYSPAVMAPPVPLVYIEQGTAPKVQALESKNWGYCSKPEGYYPYVKECPAGWQSIEPQPPGQEPGYWYYCNEPAGYYPYVRECSVIWQKIVP